MLRKLELASSKPTLSKKDVHSALKGYKSNPDEWLRYVRYNKNDTTLIAEHAKMIVSIIVVKPGVSVFNTCITDCSGVHYVKVLGGTIHKGRPDPILPTLAEPQDYRTNDVLSVQKTRNNNRK